jgi:hypothetical protein
MTTYRILLPHPLEPRLLMLNSHGEWRLPQWEDAGQRSWAHVDHVNRAVAARFGAETTVIRCVRELVDPLSGEAVRYYELENHSPAHDMPAASSWIGSYELDSRIDVDAQTREIMSEWFARANGGMPDRGPSWMRRGWYVQALAWSVARLRECGAVPQASPEQLRASERSFLMRFQTDQGCYYFKAVPSAFAHEVRLARWLRDRFGGSVAELTACDAARHWMLLRDVREGAAPLAEVRDVAVWERAARRLAEVQLACSSQASALRSIGVPQRSLDVLALRIPLLCADTSAMMLGSPCGLTRREIETVAGLAPALVALVSELSVMGLPDTLDHGDLSATNIVDAGQGPVFLDWSDSSISHPFFSLSRLIHDAASLLPASSAETHRRLRDAYLAPWSSIAPMDELLRAYEIAHRLAPVQAATVAHAELIPGAGYRWEVGCAVPTNLRHALDLLLEI